jgi:hypothetical protein
MKKSTKLLFDKVCADKGAFFIEGISNPIWNNDGITTIFIAWKGKIVECKIDTKSIHKIKNKGMWMCNNSPLSKRPRVINSKHIPIYHYLIKPRTNYVIDHINRDTLDNRMCNLRQVTPGENMLNKKVYDNSTHGVPGLITFKDGYRVQVARAFQDKTLAVELIKRIIPIIDEYSTKDAKNRTYKTG